LRLDYPNEFDRARAAEEGRTNLGGDIMIHGGKGSVGCLAMGDEAVEELFVLVSDVGKRNVTVVLSPLDFRSAIPPPGLDTSYRWTPELYAEIRAAVQKLPQAQTQSLDGTESY
jgi:hypothetical protein